MNVTWLYVGALYAIAVWLARRSGIELRRRIAFFFYLLVLVFLFRPMTQAYVGVPADCVARIPPWSFVDRAQPVNCEMNDIVTQMVPWAGEVRHDWKSLRFPLWSARSGSGSVLLANMQSAAFSPLRILALPLSLGNSFTAEAAMKMLIALTCAFLFCRRRSYSELASAAGAVAFGFCTFLVVWLHFGHATVAAFLPGVLLAIDLLAERVTRGRFVFAVAVWVAVIFGGHPETALHIFLFAALMVIWMLVVERSLSMRRVATLAAALVLAVLVAAPQLAPFAEALRRSDRYALVKANPPAIAFTDRAAAILLAQPAFFGLRPLEATWGPAPAESLSGFAGVLGFAGWLALLIDAIATRRWRTREMFFVVASPLVLAIILDWPPVGPGFHTLFSFANNARLRLLLAFLVAMQSAAAIDLLEKGRRRPVAIGVAATAAFLVALAAMFDFPPTALRAMLPSAIVLVLAVVPLPRLLILVAIIAEVWSVGIRWNPAVDARWMDPSTPLIAKLQELQSAWRMPMRIVGLGAVLYPNTGSMYDFEDIRTHDPMANARYLGVLRVLTGYDTQSYFAHFENADAPLLDFLNVAYVVTGPAAELDRGRYELVYDGKDGRIFRNRAALQRFFAVRNVVLEFKGFAYAQRLAEMRDFTETAIVNQLPVVNDRMRLDLLAPRPVNAPEPWVNFSRVSDTEYTLHVRAPRYSLIASSIPLWPGWRVEIAGKRVEPVTVDGAFLGFTVPPGDSDIRVQYVPMTFYAGLIVSALAIAGIVVAARVKR